MPFKRRGNTWYNDKHSFSGLLNGNGPKYMQTLAKRVQRDQKTTNKQTTTQGE